MYRAAAVVVSSACRMLLLSVALLGAMGAQAAEYVVRGGDTLMSIAAAQKPEKQGATLEQMAWAILVANPDVFALGLDLPPENSVVKIPDRRTVLATPPNQAARKLAQYSVPPTGGTLPSPSPLPETTGSPLTTPPPVQATRPAAPPSPPARARPAVAEGGPAIEVSGFEFTGNTVFASEVLAVQVAGYTGRALTLFEIYEAADKVTAFYTKNGYTLASVTVPAQSMAGGTVRLEVIEGRIAQVRFEGNRRYTDEQLTTYLGEAKSGQIYRGDVLFGNLLTVNRLPGIQAKAVLRPGDAYGTSDLLIQATERPVSASLVGDNYGRETIGEYRSSLNGVFNNPFRLEDQLQVLVLHSQQNLLNYGFVAYNLPLWTAGPRLGVSYGYADFELGGDFTGFEGTNSTARLWLEQNLVRTGRDDLNVTLAVSHTDADAGFTGTDTVISATQITLFDLGGSYNHVYDRLGVSQVTLNLSSNFRSSDSFPIEDQPLRVELDLQHLLTIYGRLDGYMRFNGVYSDDPLPDVTRMSLGGPGNLRGYPAASARGDQGTFFSTGLRQGVTLGRFTLFGRVFGETGQVRTASGSLLAGKESLANLGVGADLLVTLGRYNLAAKVDWSFPESRTSSLNPGDTYDSQRIFATVSIGF